ncbi:MAG: hypothetical protein H6858_01315 [Rhodospirillales bacterium]|nr:hypothetical protein [Alphaproteobacteria bacterium]MCB1840195.1 hypothetical protein [Alphaproteobacteria bacterium]MCB9976220.1 hypothetical protein [Rhodospirillales bacterium]
MIEAVNSSVSSAAVLRVAAEQVSTQRSGNPARIQEIAELRDGPQVPYVSPYIYLDLNYNKAVLQIRDSGTGDVVRQFPSEESLEVRRLQQVREQRSADAEEIITPEIHQQASRAAQAGITRVPGTTAASADIITVQDVTSTPPANSASAPPQIATAAFSVGGQTSGTPSTTTARVSVLA